MIDKVFTNFKKFFVKVAWKCLQKSQNRVQLYCEIINKSKFLTLFLKVSENRKKFRKRIRVSNIGGKHQMADKKTLSPEATL